MAMDALHAARQSRALASLLRRKASRIDDARKYDVGEVVYFRRPLAPGSHKSLWHGPATISGRIEYDDALNYRIEYGGKSVTASRYDVKGVNEPLVGGNTEGVAIPTSQDDLLEASPPEDPALDNPTPEEPEHAADERQRDRLTKALGRLEDFNKAPPQPDKPAVAPAMAHGINAIETAELEPRRSLRLQEKKEEKRLAQESVAEEPKNVAEEPKNVAGLIVSNLPSYINDCVLLAQTENINTVLHGTVCNSFNALLVREESRPSWADHEQHMPIGTSMFGTLAKETLLELQASGELAVLDAMSPRTALLTFMGDVRDELSQLHALTAELSALDKYNYELSDVEPERVVAAHEKAIGDYDRSGSWDSNTDTPCSLIAKGKLLKGRWVDVVKIINGSLDVKSRWTPKGFMETDDGQDFSSPTATMIGHRVQETWGLKKRWKKFEFDISFAFFQSDLIEDGKELWVELPPELQPSHSPKMARRLLREVPGTKSSPRSFFLSFRDWILKLTGFVQSKVDKCVFLKFINGVCVLTVDTHVDDGKGWGEPSEVETFRVQLMQRWKLAEDGFRILVNNVTEEYCGVEWTLEEDGCRQTQHKYIDTKLKEIPIEKSRARRQDTVVTPDERAALRSTNGALRWVHKTAPEISYLLSTASSAQSREDCTVADLQKANRAVRACKEGTFRPVQGQTNFREKPSVFLPRLDKEESLKVVVITDAAEPKGNPLWHTGQWRGGILIGIMDDTWDSEGKFATIFHKAGPTTRVAHSSFDGETLTAIEGLDVGLSIAQHVEEYMYGVRPSLWQRKQMELESMSLSERGTVPIELHTDADDLVKRTRRMTFDPGLTKRRKTDICDFQECIERGELRPLTKIDGAHNPIDFVTKDRPFGGHESGRLLDVVRDGYYVVRY